MIRGFDLICGVGMTEVILSIFARRMKKQVVDNESIYRRYFEVLSGFE